MEAKITSLLIYNPTYGPKEGQEHLKLLYYYPESEKQNIKLNNIGLCEALVQFTRNFSPDQPCESLHTQKHRQVFVEPEENFWMVLSVSNPVKEVDKDGTVIKVYQEENLGDSVLKSMLTQMYDHFKLLHGTFVNIVSLDSGVEILKEKLTKHFSLVIPQTNVLQKDIITVCNGIQFMPTSKSTFLNIQSLLNNLKEEFCQIKQVHLLYEDLLIWTDLVKSDAATFNSYLQSEVIQSMMDSDPTLGSYGVEDGSFGRFLIPRKQAASDNSDMELLVFVKNEEKHLKEHYVIIYQVIGITLCMFMTESSANMGDIFGRLDVFLGEPLINLATEIETQLHNNPEFSDPSFKYIYWNSSTLATKTHCHTKWKDGTMKCIVPPETMRIIQNTANEFESRESDTEIITKAENDYWVVGRKTENHNLYIVVNLKNANLIEVNEQVKRMTSESFNNIVFMD